MEFLIYGITLILISNGHVNGEVYHIIPSESLLTNILHIHVIPCTNFTKISKGKTIVWKCPLTQAE